MVDIHTHILPGLDDGPDSIEESLAMLRASIGQGITDIILTPHYIHGEQNNTKTRIDAAVKGLSDCAKNAGIDIRLYPGSEVFIFHDMHRYLEDGTICTLNNSEYVLIELPFTVIPEYTKQTLYELVLRGYVPVIAHPERNEIYAKKPELLKELIDLGALVQINASSILKAYGRKICKAAVYMLRSNMVSYIASDTHSLRRRSVRLKEAYELCIKKLGESSDTTSLFRGTGLV